MPAADYEQMVKDNSASIQASDAIHERNKELIREYQRDKTLDGLTDATIAKNLSRMKQVAKHVDQPFDEMDKADMKDLIEWVQSRDYTEETVNTYKSVIKAFWTWMDPDGNGDPPDTVSWITLSNGNGNGKLPTDLLTKEDIEAQANAAKNPRDRALIWMLYETGARIGELIDLTVGDIEDRKHGRKVVIDGKTGQRRLPLVESVPYLNKWLNEHPNPEKDAPLWCKIQQGGAEDQLSYRYIRTKILEKNMDRAGIDKPSNPHHYRHSRASYLAARDEFNEFKLCQFFGWVQGSNVPSKYVHLSGDDLDEAVDRMNDLIDEDEEEDDSTTVECFRCGEINRAKATFCDNCGFALDQDKAAETEEKVDKDMKSSYAETEPGSEMQANVGSIDEVLDDYPEAKQALYEALRGESD